MVGAKKMAYDIWGDTVNVASRMESMSAPGRINISENTYSLIKREFECEASAKISVKNRGEIQMYCEQARRGLCISGMPAFLALFFKNSTTKYCGW